MGLESNAFGIESEISIYFPTAKDQRVCFLEMEHLLTKEIYRKKALPNLICILGDFEQ